MYLTRRNPGTFAKYRLYQVVSFLSTHLTAFLSLGDRGLSVRLLLRTANFNARETFDRTCISYRIYFHLTPLLCRVHSIDTSPIENTIMPNYFVGPFGRMLPVIDGPPSEQEPRSSREPMGSLYQLPPPRAPIPLRFGTDPFLRQHTPTERPNSGTGRRWDDTGPRKEQLPSVSQLLTPVSLSSASSPYDRRPGRDTQAAYSVHHNDHSLASSAPSAPIFERPTYQQPRSLPPIVNTPVRNREDELRSHPETYGTLSDQPLHHDRLPHLDATPPDKEPASDLRPSTAVTENRPQAPSVQPHVVDERYIEGEGLCYVYADSSYCPKNIDGVPVNANWGITKAGKPRKRLAQACLTCREKKIKCHPNLPKCDQCQKSGRECRFENA